MTLDEILSRLGALPEKDRNEVKAAALEVTKGRYFVPNIGPQTIAFLCSSMARPQSNADFPPRNWPTGTAAGTARS